MNARTIFVAILVVLGLCGSAWAFSGAGSGTEADPYIITTIQQLQEMVNDLTAYYELGNDIDASGTVSWNTGAGFEPVGLYTGDPNDEFTGTFDGKGHTITGLYINRPSTDSVGLFALVRDGSEIKNVGLINADVTGYAYVGTLVGRSSGSTVSKCWSSGNVTGIESGSINSRIGGLVGINSSGASILECSSSVAVSSGAWQVGGLTGYNGHGSFVIDCYATGSVTGNAKVGGLVGDNLFGAEGGYVTRCYSTGKVTGNGGGLIGYNWESGITYDSYWDTQTSGKTTSKGGTPKTTAEMMQQATFVDWDFVNTWDIEENMTYPFLRFEDRVSIGPIAHWKLDQGSGTIAYDSAGTNDGTIYGAAWTTGQLGGALDFDGVDDYVEVIDSDDKLDIEDNITIAAWVKLDYFNLHDHDFIVGKQPTGTSRTNYPGNYIFRTTPLNGYLHFHHQTGTGDYQISKYSSTYGIVAGEWQHCSVTLVEGGNVNFYIDGSPAGTVPQLGTFGLLNDEPVRIGTRKDEWSYFNGLLDEIYIYDRALSAGEVEQLYSFGGENLLVNGSFETAEIISGGWPSTYGDWSGDHSYIFVRYGDIWPFHGSQLLQFIGTGPFGCGQGAESQVYQIVDVSAFAGNIAADKATALASAYFNRAPGDPDTDTECYLDIRAFEGDPGSFPSLQDTGGMHIAAASTSIFTDSDPATWQRCETQLVLPANTDYIVVGINAMENVYNDTEWPEFDGHCADAVSLTIAVEPNVPEPEEIYYVDGVNGSDDNNGLSPEAAFATIQMGIDMADDGVIVYPAVYNQGIRFGGKPITVQGTPNLSSAPVLEVSGAVAVLFLDGEGPDSMLKNFVIRNSNIGVLIDNASPTISNVTVVDNNKGISAEGISSPEISNSIFWNNTIDLDQCQARYSYVQDANVLIEEVISQWNFDEGSGTMVNDSVGANDGTIYGATWTTGQIDGALSFDGVNDYVQIADDPSLRFTQNDSFSISFWAKPSTSGGYIFSKLRTNAQYGVFGYACRWLSSSSKFQFITEKSRVANVFANTPDNSAPPGNWYYVTIVYDNKDMEIYLNGELKGSNTFSQNTGSTSPDNSLTIGVRLYDSTLEQYFGGIIDDVMIFRRADNVDTNPYFSDAANGDYHLLSERGRYWPLHNVWVLDGVTSPCIDGGDPAEFPANERMPNGGRINMGVYGNTADASMSQWPLRHDSNFDAIVNMLDLARLGLEWQDNSLPSPPPPPPPPPLPSQAGNPNPADGATGIDKNTDLSWTPGSNANSHNVYFGTTSPPALRGNRSAATFEPGTMANGTTYYWRIDEVNPSGITTGTVWTFTTNSPPPPPPPP
ncbi:MAG: LamG domain-containing protein [Planctomycetes bacterium]|nr:LamG domain-containing protein [Planctomycetota bacterium]